MQACSFFSGFLGPFPDVLWEPAFLTADEQARLLDFCRTAIPWERRQLTFGSRKVDVPRELAWFGDVDYVYSGIRHPARPMPEPLAALARAIEAWLANEGIQYAFNSVLLNRYRSGSDSIGMHADDEPQLEERPVIASISLGAPRTFVFEHKETRLSQQGLLTSGSLLVMKGDSQLLWRHGIPKEPGHGERINLTFRHTFALGCSRRQAA